MLIQPAQLFMRRSRPGLLGPASRNDGGQAVCFDERGRDHPLTVRDHDGEHPNWSKPVGRSAPSLSP